MRKSHLVSSFPRVRPAFNLGTGARTEGSTSQSPARMIRRRISARGGPGYMVKETASSNLRPGAMSRRDDCATAAPDVDGLAQKIRILGRYYREAYDAQGIPLRRSH